MGDKKPISIFDQLQQNNQAIVQMNKNNETTIQEITNIEQATDFIKSNDLKIASAWFNLAHCLKKVRDEKLYLEKYSSFQEYFENELKYKRTMVYKFISLAEKYDVDTTSEIVNLGVTKLFELEILDEDEKAVFIENNDINEMSVSELKNRLKHAKSINIENYKTRINFSSDEFEKFQKFNRNLNGFNEIMNDFIDEKQGDVEIDHTQICYLNDVFEKTKKDMRQLEKLIKKYI